MNQDETLKAQILQILSNGENSISGVLKELNTRGTDMHRLMLTGYLKAMADIGILKERDIKPSKIYSIDMTSRRDIYGMVGSSVRGYGEDVMADRALLLLSTIFGRPVFLKEIERCNVGLPRNYKKVVPPRRKEYIEQLAKVGLSIPESNFMMEPETRDAHLVNHLMRQLISHGFDIRDEYTGKNNSVQKTLD